MRTPLRAPSTYLLALFLWLADCAAPKSGPEARVGQAVSGTIYHVWSHPHGAAYPYASKETAALQVQTALDLAQAGDTVLVHGDCPLNADGRCTYPENLQIKCGVALRGDGTPGATPWLDGGGNARVVTGSGDSCPSGQITEVRAFEIVNGKDPDRGAGIHFARRQALIADNCIRRNKAPIGAGIAIDLDYLDHLPSPTVTVMNNCIDHNTAQDHGGALDVTLYEDELTRPRSNDGVVDVFLTGNTIQENAANNAGTSRHSWGGGVSVAGARLQSSNNLFEGNSVQPGDNAEAYGGAIGVFDLDQNSPFTDIYPNVPLLADADTLGAVQQILSSEDIFRTNRAMKGPAIAVVFNASINIDHALVSGNTGDIAGALYSSGRSYVAVQSSHFTNNSGGWGGGLYISCDGSLNLGSGNRFDNNTASRGSGGAIMIRNSRAVIQGPNSFVQNHATSLAFSTGTASSFGQGYGGAIVLWEVDKAQLLLGGRDGDGFVSTWIGRLLDQFEAGIENQKTHMTVSGQNIFDGNTAVKFGGAIAIRMLGAHNQVVFYQAGRPLSPRSSITGGAQFMNNSDGIYYEENMPREVATGNYTVGQIDQVLMHDNQGFAIRIDNTGMISRDRPGARGTPIAPIQITNSTIQSNGSGIAIYNSWPSIENVNLMGNRNFQVDIVNYGLPMPKITFNNLDGLQASQIGIRTDGGAPDPSLRLDPLFGADSFERNNFLDHTGPALLNNGTRSISAVWSYWGVNGAVVGSGANQISGALVFDPERAVLVDVPSTEFAPLDVQPTDPTDPPKPLCIGPSSPTDSGTPDYGWDAGYPDAEAPDASYPDAVCTPPGCGTTADAVPTVDPSYPDASSTTLDAGVAPDAADTSDSGPADADSSGCVWDPVTQQYLDNGVPCGS
jgi:hypothetical protein